MALLIQHLEEMTSGFILAGYAYTMRPKSPKNPVYLRWTDAKGTESKFRLWSFEITHGGGDRSNEEFRIQITSAPQIHEGMDHDGITDLVIGYSPSKNVLVAYDRRWLEKRTLKGTGSPSVQVNEQDINAALNGGVHHLTKSTSFGSADILTFKPEFFPQFLKNHNALLSGQTVMTHIPSSATNKNLSLWQFCLDRGFFFEPDMLARYVASITAKPFVILAGVSGTGKSKMAELVAEYYSISRAAQEFKLTVPNPAIGEEFIFAAEQESSKSQFALVPVRPDWIDNQSIMGFVNPITAQYESTLALDLMLTASDTLEKSTDKASAPRFFMLLDEMNLARVEHYFSDWLACSESRRLQPDGSITQQPIPLHRHTSAKTRCLGDGVEVDVPNTLAIPTNLIVTGTVNIDETTFGFSPKVLDRSMVIEFNDVDLDSLRNGVTGTGEENYRYPIVIAPFRLASTETFKALPQETHDYLVQINKILEQSQLHFGYRSAVEISLFMEIYHSILPEDNSDSGMLKALDGALLQKVLPRIQGNRARLESTLCTLLWYLRDLSMPSPSDDVKTISSGDSSKLPKTYKRGYEMLEQLRGFGFVTFFK